MESAGSGSSSDRLQVKRSVPRPLSGQEAGPFTLGLEVQLPRLNFKTWSAGCMSTFMDINRVCYCGCMCVILKCPLKKANMR